MYVHRLSEIGYRIGVRVLELLCLRDKNSRRETKISGILLFVHTTVWKARVCIRLGGRIEDRKKEGREEEKYKKSKLRKRGERTAKN